MADDHEVVRHGARLLIEREPGWSVVGEAKNGREAAALVAELQPDVAVLDINMPELNGLDATRVIKRETPGTEVLVFTGIENEQLVHNVFEAGARSYILKTGMSQHLISAIEAAARHKTYFTTQISEIVFARYLHGKKTPPAETEGSGRLTAREREIVQLLAEGKSNKEVASNLGISVKTAETHRAAVMRKLGFQAFSDLVRYAIRNHIIEA